MSHTTKLSGVPLKSLSAIRTAVERLKAKGINAKLTENLAPRMYQDYGGAYPRGTTANCKRGQQFKKDVKSLTGRQVDVAEYCIELPDSKYDVGLVWNEKEQQYDPIFDSWNGEVGKTLGVPERARGGLNATQGDLAKFYQEYSRGVAYETAADQGYIIESEYEDPTTGEIHIQIGGM